MDTYHQPPDEGPVDSVRRIVLRTRGRRRRSITRLASLAAVEMDLAPFAFIDLFEVALQANLFEGIALAPYLNIATLTYCWEGGLTHFGAEGDDVTIPPGGAEWRHTGDGAWLPHRATGAVRARGFHLSIVLPPQSALGRARTCLAQERMPRDGPARVLLGAHGGAQGAFSAPLSTNVLAVSLAAGERWRFEPPDHHRRAWLALSKGAVLAPTKLAGSELAVFDHTRRDIEIEALQDAEFVVSSAK